MPERGSSNCANSFCLSLNEQTRNHLCGIKKRIHFKEKEQFFLGRKSLFLITQGNLVVYRTNDNGKRQGTEFLHKGDLLGVTSLYQVLGNVTDICVYAKSDGESCVFPAQEFVEYCLIYPDATLAVMKNTIQRFGVIIRMIDHISLDNSEDRIQNVLNLLFEKNTSDVTNHNLPTLPFSHEELAMFAGLNRVTTTRAIDKLQKQGLFATGRCNIKKLPVRQENTPKPSAINEVRSVYE